MKKIGYMGFNETMILEIIENKDIELSFIITQKDRLSRTMLTLLDVMDIPYYIVENKKDLMQYENLFQEVDFLLSYCFGIIIPNDIIEKYQCFNIHPGDLKTNRGPYPLVRNILNNDKEAVATLHKIGNKIDTGIVIAEYKVKIYKTDNDITLLKKLNEGCKFLLEKLLEFDNNIQYPVIMDGKYYKKVKEKEIMIQEQDDYEEMNRKIRAQKSYGGALANYKQHLVKI